MPTLREWMLHFPTDWTPAQAQGFVQDTTFAMTNAMQPIAATVGPDRACAILLTIVTYIARANPVYHENIKDLLANTFDSLETINPFPKGPKQ